MAFDDRLMWLLLGVAIGFFLGYITRTLREIKEEIHEVNELSKQNPPPKKRDEEGRFKLSSRTINGLLMAVVVLLTAFASFKSQAASNQAEDNAQQLEQVVGCLIGNQTDMLNALNTRTTYTQNQALANRKLQESQAEFFAVLLHRPPYTAQRRENAAFDYQKALAVFLGSAEASEDNAKITKYPESADLLTCIEEQKEE